MITTGMMIPGLRDSQFLLITLVCHQSEQKCCPITWQIFIANVCSIIFVHGFTGDREETWTAQGKSLWPRDVLSRYVPTARILTWGYGTGFYSKSSEKKERNGLRSIGRTLARNIETWREDTVTPKNHPIIFVAHSIGGIVVEQVCGILRIKSVEDIANINYYKGFD